MLVAKVVAARMTHKCYYVFMRTTVDLPDELMRKAKMRSAERGESLKEMFVRIVEREVSSPGLQGSRGRMQLPLVRGSGKPAAAISNADIAEILDDEDMENLTL